MKIVNITQPVGVIPESVQVIGGRNRRQFRCSYEYLCVDALIWKRQEAYRKIKDDGITDESMEISIKKEKMVDGMYVISNDLNSQTFCLAGNSGALL